MESEIEQRVWNLADTTARRSRLVIAIAETLTYVALLVGAFGVALVLSSDAETSTRVGWAVCTAVSTLWVIAVLQGLGLFGTKCALEALRSQMEVLDHDDDDE